MRDRRQEGVLHSIEFAKLFGPVPLQMQGPFDLFEPHHAARDPFAHQHAHTDRGRRRGHSRSNVARQPQQRQGIGRGGQRGHDQGRTRRLGQPDPHKGDHEENAVGVLIRPPEGVRQGDQGEHRRDDREAGPPGPGSPGRRPDGDTGCERSHRDQRRCGPVRPRRRKRERGQAQQPGPHIEDRRQPPQKAPAGDCAAGRARAPDHRPASALAVSGRGSRAVGCRLRSRVEAELAHPRQVVLAPKRGHWSRRVGESSALAGQAG